MIKRHNLHKDITTLNVYSTNIRLSKYARKYIWENYKEK